MTQKVIVIFAIVVTIVALVPFVTTMEQEPAPFVTLEITGADPAVAPNIQTATAVEAPVIVELLITNVCVAPEAMLTPLNTT